MKDHYIYHITTNKSDIGNTEVGYIGVSKVFPNTTELLDGIEGTRIEQHKSKMEDDSERTVHQKMSEGYYWGRLNGRRPMTENEAYTMEEYLRPEASGWNMIKGGNGIPIPQFNQIVQSLQDQGIL